MNNLKTLKTIDGKTAKQLIEGAKVIELICGDFEIRVRQFALILDEDNYKMYVSYWNGETYAAMLLAKEEGEMLKKLEDEVATQYEISMLR